MARRSDRSGLIAADEDLTPEDWTKAAESVRLALGPLPSCPDGRRFYLRDNYFRSDVKKRELEVLEAAVDWFRRAADFLDGNGMPIQARHYLETAETFAVMLAYVTRREAKIAARSR